MTRLAIFDFDGTLAEERPPQSLKGVPEHPEVIEQFLTHHADPQTEVFVVTGRHVISRAAIVQWLKRTTDADFPPARVYTRWDLDPATGPSSKVANLRQLLQQWVLPTPAPHKAEVMVYDNDRQVLGLYYGVLHPLVPKMLRFCLNQVDERGRVEDVTQELGQARVAPHEPQR